MKTPLILTLALAALIALTGERGAMAQPSMGAIYPFGTNPDLGALSLPDQSPLSSFVLDEPWTAAAEANAEARLTGVSGVGLACLLMRNSAGNSVVSGWALRHVDGADWFPADGATLWLSGLQKDVYEVQPTTSLGTLPAFWVAWPSNAIPADHSPPAGAVHGAIITSHSGLLLDVQGYVWDAIQAGLTGNSGVARAEVVVDDQTNAVPLNQHGKFTIQVPIQPRKDGVHTVTLYATDTARNIMGLVDMEYVSEHGWPFPEVPPPGSGGSGGHQGGFDGLHRGYDASHAIAIAKPRLDENGLLILDGRESVDTGNNYTWTIENLGSGAIDTVYSYDDWGEPIVSTEGYPPGFYRVTLDCSSFDGIDGVRPNARNNTSFYLVIPPRVALATREVAGALHVRWVPELDHGKWVWCLYLNGHVFDEIGKTLYQHSAGNLRAWIKINGVRSSVRLDQAGRFLARRPMSYPLRDKYDIELIVMTQDDQSSYVPDSLRETRLSIFPPWTDVFFPQR